MPDVVDRPAPARSAGSAPASPWDVANSCTEGGRADPYADDANARRRRRLAGFRALSLLWRYSSLDRVRKCRRFVVRKGSLVGVVVRWAESRAHFAGLQTCGSVWACPCCSERILSGRVDDLLAAIDTHRAAGGEVAMVTLTMRHDRGQALGELWDGLGEAWRAASRALLGEVGKVPWVRRVEATHGDRHGWHVHVHALLFVESGADVAAMGESMFAGWSRRLVSMGFAAPLRDSGGLQAKLLDLAGARLNVAEYLTKGQYDGVDARRRAALELASSSKAGRGANRTPMQVLADMVSLGEARDFELWREWELASKGRRSITWAKGARKRLVLDVEQTDEELAQETDGGGELVAYVRREALASLVERVALKAAVLWRAETSYDAGEAFDRIERELVGAGLVDAVVRPPPRGERVKE